MYALTVVSVALLAGQAAAASAFLPRSLFPRQLTSSDVPTQCQSVCDPVITALDTCTTIACICASSVNTGLYNCLECGLALEPDSALMAEAQSSLTEYESSCAAGGVSVTSLTLTLPAAAASASASGSAAPISGSASATATFSDPFSFTDSDTDIFESTAAAGTTAGATAAQTADTTTTTSGTSDSGVTNPLATKSGDARGLGASLVGAVGAFGVAFITLAL